MSCQPACLLPRGTQQVGAFPAGQATLDSPLPQAKQCWLGAGTSPASPRRRQRHIPKDGRPPKALLIGCDPLLLLGP
jgi:hypothetical protein